GVTTGGVTTGLATGPWLPAGGVTTGEVTTGLITGPWLTAGGVTTGLAMGPRLTGGVIGDGATTPPWLTTGGVTGAGLPAFGIVAGVFGAAGPVTTGAGFTACGALGVFAAGFTIFAGAAAGAGVPAV